MKNGSIDLTGVPETMLQTLYARAKESKKANHCIYDKKAIETAEALDYDFSSADKDSVMSSGVIARTIILDREVNRFIKENPGAVIVNMACGLDTRCYRCTEGYGMWYNIDLPETIAVRRRFFEETDRIKQIAESADCERWAEKIDAENKKVLIIVEGLSMYLREEQIVKFFSIADKKFPSAAVFFEIMNPSVVKHIKEKSIKGSGAEFIWGVKDGKTLQELVSPFRAVKDISLAEGMQEFMPVYKFLKKIPLVSNISNKIVILEK